MPLLEPDQSIEDIYRDHIRKMSPAEKIKCVFSLFGSSYRAQALRLQAENPEMTERQVRIEMAKRMYGGDPGTMELIAMCENNEHHDTRTS